MTEPSQAIDQITAILDSFSLEEAEAEVLRLQAEAERVQATLQKFQALVAFKRQLGNAGNGDEPSERLFVAHSSKPPPLRQAILAVMNEWRHGSYIRLAQLRERLVERGWLTDSDSDAHRLQVTAGLMVRRGTLQRPEKGFYQLPPSESEGKDRRTQG